MTVTPENVAERCAYWQRVLRLQDWDVDVVFVRRHELDGTSVLGQTRIDSYKRARVRIIDPFDYTPLDHWPIDRDSEATLVHELLHLHFDDCRIAARGADDRDTHEWRALERGIEYTARALLALDRAVHEVPV